MKTSSHRIRQRAISTTEYLVVLALVAIATITMAGIFGAQKESGLARSAAALAGQSGPSDLASAAGFEAGKPVGMDWFDAGASGASQERRSAGNGVSIGGGDGGKNTIGPTTPSTRKERLSALQQTVETILKNRALSEDEKTEHILNKAATMTGGDIDAAHKLVQDLRRYGWSDADQSMYNYQSLVNAHYYLKGRAMGRSTFGDLSVDVYDDMIKQHLGSGAADAVAEFWSGRNDKRPSSPYSPQTREWFNKGAEDRAQALRKVEPELTP